MCSATLDDGEEKERNARANKERKKKKFLSLKKLT
jgi:hypothetical protein